MEMKLIAFLLAGVMVGAAAGVGVGYYVFNDGSSDNNSSDLTYYFYLYYEDESDLNRWISAKSSTPLTAFTAALDAADIDYDISSTGWIYHIGDESDYAEDWDQPSLTGHSWISWFWASTVTDPPYSGMWREPPGWDTTFGTIFLVGFTSVELDPDTWEMLSDLNPNFEMLEWMTGGPVTIS